MPQFTSPRPVLAPIKARNPWAVAARNRKAGAHAPANPRQTAQRAIAQQLRELWSPPRDT